MTRRFLPGLIIALGVLALGLVVAFTVGRYPIGLGDVMDVLLAKLTGRASGVSPAVEQLLGRPPRPVDEWLRECLAPLLVR